MTTHHLRLCLFLLSLSAFVSHLKSTEIKCSDDADCRAIKSKQPYCQEGLCVYCKSDNTGCQFPASVCDVSGSNCLPFFTANRVLNSCPVDTELAKISANSYTVDSNVVLTLQDGVLTGSHTIVLNGINHNSQMTIELRRLESSGTPATDSLPFSASESSSGLQIQFTSTQFLNQHSPEILVECVETDYDILKNLYFITIQSGCSSSSGSITLEYLAYYDSAQKSLLSSRSLKEDTKTTSPGEDCKILADNFLSLKTADDAFATNVEFTEKTKTTISLDASKISLTSGHTLSLDKVYLISETKDSNETEEINWIDENFADGIFSFKLDLSVTSDKKVYVKLSVISGSRRQLSTIGDNYYSFLSLTYKPAATTGDGGNSSDGSDDAFYIEWLERVDVAGVGWLIAAVILAVVTILFVCLVCCCCKKIGGDHKHHEPKASPKTADASEAASMISSALPTSRNHSPRKSVGDGSSYRLKSKEDQDLNDEINTASTSNSNRQWVRKNMYQHNDLANSGSSNALRVDDDNRQPIRKSPRSSFRIKLANSNGR